MCLQSAEFNNAKVIELCLNKKWKDLIFGGKIIKSGRAEKTKISTMKLKIH